MVEPTQEDREAAARIGANGIGLDHFRKGEVDWHPLVQAFARHRIAAVEADRRARTFSPTEIDQAVEGAGRSGMEAALAAAGNRVQQSPTAHTGAKTMQGDALIEELAKAMWNESGNATDDQFGPWEANQEPIEDQRSIADIYRDHARAILPIIEREKAAAIAAIGVADVYHPTKDEHDADARDMAARLRAAIGVDAPPERLPTEE